VAPLSKRFRTLDALRGLAALAVAIYHRHELFAGYLAVDFFLVLSGFVLSHSYLYRERPVGARDFICRRLARLWPLHVVTIFTAVGIWRSLNPAWPESDSWLYEHCNLNTFLQNLALVHNVGLPPQTWSWNIPSWSISVEFWVNVVFILFVRQQTRSWKLLALAVASLGVIYWQTGSLKTDFENYFTYLNSGLLRGMASFFLGILSYRFFLATRERSPGLASATVLEVLSLTIAILLGFANKGGYPALELAAPPLFMFMVPLFAYERGLLSRCLRPIDHLGTISYSIYLNHYGLMMYINTPWLSRHVPEPLSTLLYLVVVLIVSQFTYYEVELRGQRWMKAFFARIGGLNNPI